MRNLEVRRHTMRTQPGQHLSQAGVELARRIGSSMGPFDRVVTSTIPRAFETAIAMGFAVDEQIDALGAGMEGVGEEVDWTKGFAEFARGAALGSATARFVQSQAALWRSIVAALPEGGSALVITHGGFVEAGAVGCLPRADHERWGPMCDYCEGVRLSFDGESFSGIEILRLPSASQNRGT